MTMPPPRLPALCAMARMAALSWIVAGCAAPLTDPTASTQVAAVSSRPTGSALVDFELRQRDQALALARQSRLAEAALAWEVLSVLRPEIPEYRDQLARTRRQIEVATADRLQRAAQAQKRGDLEQASQFYLAALALQPDHAQAADALRAIERERNKRTFLGKPSRFTLTQKATSPSATTSSPGNATGAVSALSDRNELEHAVMLTVQREYDGAIVLLERRLAAHRQDEIARSLLADAYFQKAEELAASENDRAGAIAALEKSVRFDASHPTAATRLKQLRAAAPAPVSAAASSSPPGVTKDVRRTGRRDEPPQSKP